MGRLFENSMSTAWRFSFKLPEKAEEHPDCRDEFYVLDQSIAWAI